MASKPKKQTAKRLKKTSHPNKTVEKVVNRARRSGGTKQAVKAAKKAVRKGITKVTPEVVKENIPAAVANRKPSEQQVAMRATAKQKKLQTQVDVTKELAPLAKQINARLELADKADSKADDHRLSAAIELEQARKRCHEMKMPFKQWCAANVTKGFETIRKLVAVGAAEDPKLALQDLRDKNAGANRKLRENKKAEVKQLEKEARVGRRVSRDTEAEEKAELKRAEGAPPQPRNTSVTNLDDVKAIFGSLKASDKVEFIKWCATELGFELKTGFEVEDDAA